MIEQGTKVTCSGCGVSTFVNSFGPYDLKKIHKAKEGTVVKAYNENQSESWARVQQVMDLCPRCQRIHEEVMVTFYDKCMEGVDHD